MYWIHRIYFSSNMADNHIIILRYSLHISVFYTCIKKEDMFTCRRLALPSHEHTQTPQTDQPHPILGSCQFKLEDDPGAGLSSGGGFISGGQMWNRLLTFTIFHKMTAAKGSSTINLLQKIV